MIQNKALVSMETDLFEIVSCKFEFALNFSYLRMVLNTNTSVSTEIKTGIGK